jgi:hypothetical protein
MPITYPDKDKNQTDGREKFTDANANEIKAVVNAVESGLQNPTFPQATFQSQNLPVLGLKSDNRLVSGVTHYGDIAIPSDTLSFYYEGPVSSSIYIGIVNGGIKWTDGVFNEITFTPAGVGVDYTGDAVPALSPVNPLEHTDGFLYYCTGNTGDFYILDSIGLTNIKKTPGGVGSVRKILYDSVHDKIILLCTAGIVSYNTVADTFVKYIPGNANYSGDNIPTVGISNGSIDGDILFFATSSGTTAERGFYRFNLTTPALKKWQITSGLPGGTNSVTNALLLSPGIVLVHTQSTTVPFSRFDNATETFTGYGNATANYSGDAIPASVFGAAWFDPNTGYLIARGASGLLFASLTGSFGLNVVTVCSAVIGNKISNTAYVGNILFQKSYLDTDPVFIFVGNSSIGIQEFKLYSSNPIKLIFDDFGMQYFSSTINKSLIGPFGLVYRQFIDELDVRIKALEVLFNPTISVLTNGQTINTVPGNSLSHIFYYTGSTPITVNVNINSSVLWQKISFVQGGTGAITLSNITGKTLTTGMNDVIDLVRLGYTGSIIGK